jgi:ArsR family transcriptional regulator
MSKTTSETSETSEANVASATGTTGVINTNKESATELGSCATNTCYANGDIPVQLVTAIASLPNDEVIYKATEIFSALADSTRFRILTSLIEGELCVCDLTEICNVSQSAVSHQLRLLRDRGLVRSRREGQRVVYSLQDEHVRCLICVGIEHATHTQMG